MWNGVNSCSDGFGFILDALVVGVTVLIFDFIFEVIGGSRCFLYITTEYPRHNYIDRMCL
jgi:hypothetical protein